MTKGKYYALPACKDVFLATSATTALCIQRSPASGYNIGSEYPTNALPGGMVEVYPENSAPAATAATGQVADDDDESDIYADEP